MFKNPVPKTLESSYTTNETPIQVIVQTGTSDTTNTEITSGLKIGDQVITKTTNSTSKTTTAAPANATTGRTGGGLGGGGIRIGG